MHPFRLSRSIAMMALLISSLVAAAPNLYPDSAVAGRAAARIIVGTIGSDPLATVSQGLEEIARQRRILETAEKKIPPNSAAVGALKEAAGTLDRETAKLRKRRESLGHCRVLLGGTPLDPQRHVIVVPDGSTAQERYAARELRYHLELITGALFDIETETEAAGKPGFYLGKTGLARRAGIDVDSLGLEGIYLKTVGPSLVLTGNQRGVLYAVITFLQDNLNCRWFTPDCATWPTTGEVVVPTLDRRYVPPLEFRAGDYPVARSGEFALHLRLNGNNHQMSAEQGGRKGVRSLAHTFASLVPPSKYFAQHPEYFSLVNGKRQSGYAQLCLTNPDVLRLVIAGVRRWIRENPDMKVFSVSQNDTAKYCECENCRRVAEEEGSQAGPMIRFVNAVADAIKDDYPDVAIETLAYQYTRKPPKLTRPRPNVIVCLCSIECCFIHPLESDPFNQSFVDDIKGWHRLCNRLWIWDYIINYAHSICPFPNLYVLKPNIDFFIHHGVTGIYEESCYYTKGSELQELRNYIIGQTLWDPSYDTDKAIDEFCAAYYGEAAPYIRQYIDLIHRETRNVPGLHVRIYTHPRDYVTPVMISESKALFDQAEAAVSGKPTLLHRVQVARLPIMYAEIVEADSGDFVERDGRLTARGGTDVSALVDRFAKIAHAEGVTRVREGGPQAGLDAWLATAPRRPRSMDIETLQNAVLRVQVLPALGGRVYRMTYLPTGKDILRVVGTATSRHPTEGGYEEYSGSGYRAPGWSEVYTVKHRDARSLTLEAKLSNGLRLTRRLELDEKKPILHITSTVTNVGHAPRTASVRSHPEFAVVSLADASARVRRQDGSWQTIRLADPGNPEAETEDFLRGKDVPEGAWAVVDEQANLAVVNHFRRDQVKQALLNRSGKKNRVNLELYSVERTLKPGQQLTLEQSIDIVKPSDVSPNP